MIDKIQTFQFHIFYVITIEAFILMLIAVFT